MRKQILNVTVLVIALMLSLSLTVVLPAAGQDKERIISKLEELRSMVENEHPSLENKVNAVIHQIEAGAFNGALNKMINDVNKTVTQWVSDPSELYRKINEIVDLIKGVTPPTPDFQLSASPSELEIMQNSSEPSTIKVKAFHGFNQPVNLSAELTPASDNITLQLIPETIVPTPAGNTSTLTVEVAASAETREYAITVSGTNGTLLRSVNITLVVTTFPPPPPSPDFAMEASPSTLSIQKGDSDIVVVTVTSLEGFNSTVALAVVSEAIANVNVTLNPTLVDLSVNESAFSVLTIDVGSNATVGSYNIAVNGTSDTLEHSVSIALNVTAPPTPPTPDFAVAVSPTALTVQQGQTDEATVIVASLHGFNQSVTLNITSQAIAGVNIALEPLEVTPPADGFANATLTVVVSIDALPGQYIITITGTRDGSVRSANVTLTVIAEKTAPVIVSVLRQPEKPSYNQTVAVQASVVDVGSGVKDVIFSFSGGASWKNETMILAEGLYRAVVPAFPFNTTVSYQVFASDKAGNNAVPSSVSSYVVIDPYPPVISAVSWSPTEPAALENITVHALVNEPSFSSGIDEVALWYANSSTSMWQIVPMTFKDGNWTAVILNQSDTTVTFIVEASDNAGNTAETEEQEFDVAGPVGVPLLWLLLIIVIIAAATGGAVYYWRRKEKQTSQATAAPTTATTTS